MLENAEEDSKKRSWTSYPPSVTSGTLPEFVSRSKTFVSCADDDRCRGGGGDVSARDRPFASREFILKRGEKKKRKNRMKL